MSNFCAFMHNCKSDTPSRFEHNHQQFQYGSCVIRVVPLDFAEMFWDRSSFNLRTLKATNLLFKTEFKNVYIRQ